MRSLGFLCHRNQALRLTLNMDGAVANGVTCIPRAFSPETGEPIGDAPKISMTFEALEELVVLLEGELAGAKKLLVAGRAIQAAMEREKAAP